MKINIKGRNKEITIEVSRKFNEKRAKRKRQMRSLKRVVISSMAIQLKHGSTYTTAGAIGLMQGLKYGGDFKRGVKAGLVTVGVMTTMNAVANVASQWDNIKNS